MFDSSFYNAGFTISGINDFLPFLQSIPKNKYPNLLIIGLDQWMFNENWDSLEGSKEPTYWGRSFQSNPGSKTFFSVYKDLKNGKYGVLESVKRFDKNAQVYHVGLHSVINNTGIRRDGSLQYGKQIDKLLKSDTTANDYRYKDTFKRIKTGRRKFQYGNRLNPKALVYLETLLSYCKENEIYVVGILPPFSIKVNEKMKQTGKYRYLEEIFPASQECFKKYNFELWDMTNLKKFGSTDEETIDGFHGGELCYSKILIHLINNQSKIKQYVEVERLKTDVRNRANDYIIFNY
ncbi:MAG: hypothetical protein DWQ02_04570 [Bacteroidetes bacterium]|nr:MAG: hypothetical protein DWQ02_04570 [Bacteroidota bacterium]